MRSFSSDRIGNLRRGVGLQAAAQFFDVFAAELPRAAVGEGADIPLFAQPVQLIGSDSECLRGLFQAQIFFDIPAISNRFRLG